MSVQPKEDGLVHAVIDGIAIAVKPGTRIIDAAKQIGISIPHYCYHQRSEHCGQLPYMPGRN